MKGYKFYQNVEVKENEIGGHVARIGRKGIHISFWLGKEEGERYFSSYTTSSSSRMTQRNRVT
jgi:hypothetical protein